MDHIVTCAGNRSASKVLNKTGVSDYYNTGTAVVPTIVRTATATAAAGIWISRRTRVVSSAVATTSASGRSYSSNSGSAPSARVESSGPRYVRSNPGATYPGKGIGAV
jgi:tRNA G18 (ribose-2'-O)-methylase SpoU